MRETAGLLALLALLGAGWGLTTPLTKIAVRDGYGAVGLVFWQLALGAVVLGLVQLLRRRPLVLVSGRALAFGTLIALTGTILPNSASYQAANHLPAGIMAIAVSAVPMFAFPIALALGMDRLSALRVLGLALGLGGVALIALPEASLPAGAAAPWVLVALFAPFCYAVEGNVVARWGTAGMGPIQTLFAASVIGAILSAPLALATGQFITPRWPLGEADLALIALAVIHAVVYAGYVWLVGRAGSVFAAQVAYLVTGFGVLWSMLMLGERYATTVWLALALMLAGVALVQPRRRRPLAPGPVPVKDRLRPDAGTP
ncbi:DMT family transporter [Histidinibacterium aquaticum]|uniref:DMT family transporter n=1 Tax=Histidinibacterium aquaticum TaxID=2613962 RepID=A0A5J5GQ71_9RHOB|nr:DMT family transporter [Histidinibacterium aquaticum]KAA9010215.1 DMT family transporter [Histidinibacterium aquaticum]